MSEADKTSDKNVRNIGKDIERCEQCIGIFEQLKEVAKFFNTSSASISSSISRKEKRNHLIERVEVGKNDRRKRRINN